MRPNVTRRNKWAELGIGACALLLPMLALGAAFYSMLATPDEGDAPSPAGAQAATQAASPDMPGPMALIGQPAVGKSAEDVARKWDRVSVQGGSVQVNSGPVTPVQVAAPPVAAVVPPGAATPAADSPSAAAAPKRPIRRHAQRQQEAFPLKSWLQEFGVEFGILPRNSNSRGG
jgi:hypothetical protein